VTDFLLIGGIVLLLAVVVLLLMLLRKASQTNAAALASRLDSFEKTQERIERAVREEVSQSRDELGKAAREQRQELTEAFKTFGNSVVQRMMDVASLQKGQLDAFSNQLGSFAKASGERLDGVRAESATGAKQLREEVVATLKTLSETITQTMHELGNVQKGQLDGFSDQLGSFAKASGERLDGVRAESATGAKQLREEVIAALKGITEATTKTMGELANVQPQLSEKKLTN
jgi:DNA recombination protein RmuC